MYENRNDALLTRTLFARRLAIHFSIVMVLLVLSLAVGMAGYMYFERLEWRDAFLNASMLLGGMGPVDPPDSDGGKLFAGFYALYAGLFIIVAAGVLLSPILHRLMHRFHLDVDEDGKVDDDEKDGQRS